MRTWSRRRKLGVGGLFAWLVVCVVTNESPSAGALPESEGACVLVTATPLPLPLGYLSCHTAFLVRGPEPGAPWERYEVWQSLEERAKDRWGHVHKDLFVPAGRTGPLGLGAMGGGPEWIVASVWGDEAARFIARLREESRTYVNRAGYLAYPGPNSNTYVNTMLRRCGLDLELPPTAIGKDYRGALGASATSGGTGAQVESPLVGVSLGLKEGLSVRVLSASFGIDLWPPATIGPFGDGRLGLPDLQ